MKKIYKYPISLHGVTTIVDVPGTGKVLYCGLDPGDEVCVWIQVSAKPGEAATRIVIHTIFTGEEFVASNLTYVNSFNTGPLAIHCFQEK